MNNKFQNFIPIAIPITFICFFSLLLTACEPEIEFQVELKGDTVLAGGDAYPDGFWKMELTGFKTEMEPSQSLEWQFSYTLNSEGLKKEFAQVEEIAIVAAARRLADQEGHYRDLDSYYYSTYLTPSGLPIEGFQYLIPNSHIGGPYKTPLDLFHKVPLESVQIDDSQLQFTTGIKATLAKDFPPGHYRIELAPFVYTQDHWFPLHMLMATKKYVASCDLNYEMTYYEKIFLPPMKIGNCRDPRVIWTLFASQPNLGIAGVVAKEDEDHFGISSRFKLAGRYILPCTPDRSKCIYQIEPELPTVFRSSIFSAKRYEYNMFEPDCSRGQITVEVKKPDGTVTKLGTHDFEDCSIFGPTTDSDDLEFEFDQFGRYEIKMVGETFDTFGDRFQAGGTYEVWVAYPLTFATGLKPGNHRKIGQYYSPAATINPPVPAEVEAKVEFFPATHPEDVITAQYHGKAQQYGYYFPDSSEPMLVFPEPGEYLFEIMATYRDYQGRVFMGNMKNAAVVVDRKANMELHGSPPWGYRRTKQLSYELDGDDGFNTGATQFPFKSGGTFYYSGYATIKQVIQPVMSVVEPTGYIQKIMKTKFFPTLIRLRKEPLNVKEQRFFPGCQDQLHYYMSNNNSLQLLPLMSTTKKGYSPFEYPELVDRRGYFYIAASRPGFPVYYVIGDSTTAENYWNTGSMDYGRTLGSAKLGDQPGDITWSVVSGIFADHSAKKSFTGMYGSGGIALPQGDNSIYESSPFENPIDTINGIDLFIYGGVGPSPGTIYETGAIKGVGSIAVPMAPHEALIDIHKPDGQIHHCRGRADEIGNFICPEGAITFDQPGAYKVYAKFWEGEHTGTCPGARAGWYHVYAVEKNSPYRVLFDSSMRRQVPFESPFPVRGRVEPTIQNGHGYYSIVAPGILIDEGTVEIRDGGFHFDIYPDQFAAQFPNLFDLKYWNPATIRYEFSNKDNSHVQNKKRLLDFIKVNILGEQLPKLSDTIEVTVFVQGEDDTGQGVSAGGKFVLRGSRVMLIQDMTSKNGFHHEKQTD